MLNFGAADGRENRTEIALSDGVTGQLGAEMKGDTS